MAKKVTFIPATIETSVLEIKHRDLRVAAYARVSSEKDEQEHSYEAQVNYYTNYIKEHPGWIFSGLYADEGKTGTNTRHRKGFQQLMTDVEDGQIDLVLCKSISRFGRNTKDVLNALEVFRRKNVECIWEKENARALDGSGDFLITIYSSLAQEESRSISENVKWGQRAAFKEGKFSMPYKHFLGYEKGPDGKPKIVESEAKVVRKIYKMCLQGKSPTYIASELTKLGIPTPGGKEKWQSTTVKSILTNEKYCGEALLQKGYVPNFLDHRVVKNEGQLPQYYVEKSHKAIVSKQIFELAQAELEKQAQYKSKVSHNPFTSKVYCKDCGSQFGRKVHHSNSKYRKVIYRCNSCYEGEKKCTSARLTEEQIADNFMTALGQAFSTDASFEAIDMAIELYSNNEQYDVELLTLRDKQGAIATEIEKLVQENARLGQLESYEQRYAALTNEYREIGQRMNELSTIISERKKRYNKLICYRKDLANVGDCFSIDTFLNLIDRVEVSSEDMVYIFKDGTKVRIAI
ncbi:MAG: recombinase family protein [Eubacterium coprostanoligenes]|nr:recombinase family protein [Eubacterium coprostanoligenes]